MDLKQIVTTIVNGKANEKTANAIRANLTERKDALIQSGKRAMFASIFEADGDDDGSWFAVKDGNATQGPFDSKSDADDACGDDEKSAYGTKDSDGKFTASGT
jgi:xanthine dehydrogenase molybdopterin-binding subunit B